MPKWHHMFVLTHSCHMSTLQHGGSSKIKHASIPIGCSWKKVYCDCHWVTVLRWFHPVHGVNGLSVLLWFLIDQDIHFFHFPLFGAICYQNVTNHKTEVINRSKHLQVTNSCTELCYLQSDYSIHYCCHL